MNARDLAALHASAFPPANRWSAASLTTLLDSPGVFVCAEPQGFALGRAVADEAELLTLCTAPQARRQGLGRRLLAGFEARAGALGARHLHLEVAADNTGARALYAAAGWREAGRRRGYYARPAGPAVDALLLCKDPGAPN